MKLLLILAGLILGQVQARAASPKNPLAPLIITCSKADGTEETVRVMKVVYSKGHAAGMNFGPDRGDEGLYTLEGDCLITVDSKTVMEE